MQEVEVLSRAARRGKEVALGGSAKPWQMLA